MKKTSWGLIIALLFFLALISVLILNNQPTSHQPLNALPTPTPQATSTPTPPSTQTPNLPSTSGNAQEPTTTPTPTPTPTPTSTATTKPTDPPPPNLVPEVPFGSIAAIVLMIVALLSYRTLLRRKNHPNLHDYRDV